MLSPSTIPSRTHPPAQHAPALRPPTPLPLDALGRQDLTPRAKDSLVSFGERLSTRLFAAYLCARGVPAKQYDAYQIGVTTNDNFVNAEVGVGLSCWGVRCPGTQRAAAGPRLNPICEGWRLAGELLVYPLEHCRDPLRPAATRPHPFPVAPTPPRRPARSTTS